MFAFAQSLVLAFEHGYSLPCPIYGCHHTQLVRLKIHWLAKTVEYVSETVTIAIANQVKT